MSNISSDKIGVFPLSKNRTANAPINSRLFYENNVSNIIRQLMDTIYIENNIQKHRYGFVISNDITLDEGTIIDYPFEFNLYGYYVIIYPLASFNIESFDVHDNIYAKLSLSGNPPEIYGQDADDVYTGIEFTTSKPNDDVIYLHILTKENGTWKIPEDSKIKFNLTSLGISAIDGKV